MNDWTVSYWLQSAIHFAREITLEDCSEFAGKEFDIWQKVDEFDVLVLEYERNHLDEYWIDNFELEIDYRANLRSAQNSRRSFFVLV